MHSHPFSKSVAAGVSAAAALALLAAGTAWSADATRGRALYEARCNDCHSTSVHQRAARRATDFAGVRLQVERWNGQLGGAWRREDIDDVTVYLNERFYKYPCPEALCRSGAARRNEDGGGVALAASGGARARGPGPQP